MTTSVEEMSSEQLKEHLYRNLRGSGVLDTMKSQLRQRLATELQKAAPPKLNQSSKTSQKKHKSSSSRHHRSSDSKTTSLSRHIASSIVAEFLKKAGFEYTLSVFLPEAGVNIDKLYSMEDLVQYLRISPSSPLYNTLVSSKDSQGILVQLLEALVESSPLLNGSCNADINHGASQRSSSTLPLQQSSPHRSMRKPRRTSVAEQLQALDQSYAQRAEQQTTKSQQNLEERLLAFQRDLEAQYKTQLENELALYRTRELAKVRLEEREKYQRDLTNERVQMTNNHQKKIDELRKAELQMLERFKKKEQDLDAGIHSQRQTLLAELDALKVRESELKRQSELNKRAGSLEEERVRAMVEQLAMKEKALQHTRDHYESMAEEKAHKYKQELEAQLQLRQDKLSRWESELKADKDKFVSLKSEIHKLTTELQTERDKSDKLQSLLHEAMSRQISLQGQKDSLQQKLDKMSDYHQLQKRSQDLQQEVLAAEKKLTDYKHRNSENQRIIKDLQLKIPRPTLEIEAIKNELDEIRKARHKETLVLENDNRELSRQLAAQTEYSHKLQKILDDQMVQLMSAQRDVKDVHILLEQLKTPQVGTSRGGAQKNGVLPHRANTVNKRVPTCSKTTSCLPRHHNLTTNLHPPHTSHPHSTTSLTGDPLLHAASGLGHRTPTPGASFSDASSHLLAESRATFARLEKEAEELEDTYHHFQHRPLNESVRNAEYSGNLESPLNPMYQSFSGEPNIREVPNTLHNVQFHPKAAITDNIPSPSVSSAPIEPKSMPHLYQHTSMTPPSTAIAWAASPAMSTQINPQMSSAQQHTSTQSLTHLPMKSVDTAPMLVPVQPLSQSVPVTTSTQLHALPTTEGFTDTQLSKELNNMQVDKNSSTISNIRSSTQEVTEVGPTLTPEPTAVSSSVSRSTPTQHTPVVSTETVQPSLQSQPKFSLDDLWKSSQHQSTSSKTDSRSTDFDKKREQLEEKERVRQEKQKEEDDKIRRELEALQKQERIQEEMSTLPVLSLEKDCDNQETPALPSVQTVDQEDKKEQAVTEKDEIDPVMLKYMELVKQRRDQQTTQFESPAVQRDDGDNSKLDSGVPSLSQVSESFGGFSDKEDDPFDDW